MITASPGFGTPKLSPANKGKHSAASEEGALDVADRSDQSIKQAIAEAMSDSAGVTEPPNPVQDDFFDLNRSDFEGWSPKERQ